MHTSTSKFYGDQNPLYGGPLHWPGVQGLPFRGNHVPNLKQREQEELPMVAQACHQVFELSDDAQARTYQWIRDRIRNGLFTLDYIERHWDESARNMVIYIEWSQLYVQAPTHAAMGSNGNGSPHSFTLRGS